MAEGATGCVMEGEVDGIMDCASMASRVRGGRLVLGWVGHVAAVGVEAAWEETSPPSTKPTQLNRPLKPNIGAGVLSMVAEEEGAGGQGMRPSDLAI